MKQLKISFFVFLMLVSCQHKPDMQNVNSSERNDADGFHAEKFSLERYNGYNLLTVYSPWQQAGSNSFSYLTGPGNALIPDSLENIPFIKWPVERAVIMSTTYVPFLDTLNVLSCVKGVSGLKFIYNEKLRSLIRDGYVRDVGYDQNLNIEVIAEIDPDVVFMYGVQSGVVQTKKKLEELGIPVVLCADYLEPDPLGRMEWLRFFAAFFNKIDLADSICMDIRNKYMAVAEKASDERNRPKVLLGMPWKDTWYIAGGNSYAARLITDAGGSYLFGDLQNEEAVPVDIEAVFLKAMDADIWLNPGVANSMDAIIQHDERFSMLQVFTEGHIYANSKRLSSGGGNDYWESGILYPDRILRDLYAIFHSTVDSDSGLFYYFRLD